MQIEKLSTLNFKKLGTKTIAFTPGLNFISGENGQGKSTVLRAIATALFGPQMLPGTADMIPTFGQNRWEVELQFSHEGSTFVIKRTKSTAQLYKDEDLVASGNTPCTAFMEDLFGFKAKDYNLLIHSRQGETAGVLNYGATALQRKVEEFAGVEVVERVAVKAGDLAKELKLTAEVRMDSIQDHSVEIRELEAVVAELEEKMRKLPSLPMEPTEPDLTVQKASTLHRNYQLYLKELEHYRERKAELETVAAEEPGPEPEQVSEGTLKELVSKLREIQNLNKQKAQKEWDLANKKALIQDLVEPEPLPDGDKIADTLEVRQEGLRSIRAEIKHLYAILKDSKCSACGTELKSINAADINGQIELLRGEEAGLLEEVEDLNHQGEQAVALAKLHQKYQENEKLKLEVEATVLEPQEDTAGLEEKIQEIKIAQELAEQRYSAWAKEHSRIEKARKSLSSLEIPPAVLEYSEEQVTAVSAQWEKYHQELETYGRVVREGEQLLLQHEQAANQLKKTQELQSKGQASKEQAEGEFAKAETAGSLQRFLRDKRSTYLTQVWDAIAAHASDFLSEASNGWLTGVRVEDGKFLFQESGAWVPTAEASGAQESFVGVALRVGISRTLYSRGFYLVFDEPTDGMTEDRARSLIASLSGTAGQVFVITHRETDQALADNIVEV